MYIDNINSTNTITSNARSYSDMDYYEYTYTQNVSYVEPEPIEYPKIKYKPILKLGKMTKPFPIKKKQVMRMQYKRGY